MKASLRFRDRTESGRRLPAALERYADRPNPLVLALPGGGVPVGCQGARALNAPQRGTRDSSPGAGASHELFLCRGSWYEDFPQVTDDELHRLLERATLTRAGSWC